MNRTTCSPRLVVDRNDSECNICSMRTQTHGWKLPEKINNGIVSSGTFASSSNNVKHPNRHFWAQSRLFTPIPQQLFEVEITNPATIIRDGARTLQVWAINSGNELGSLLIHPRSEVLSSVHAHYDPSQRWPVDVASSRLATEPEGHHPRRVDR